MRPVLRKYIHYYRSICKVKWVRKTLAHMNVHFWLILREAINFVRLFQPNRKQRAPNDNHELNHTSWTRKSQIKYWSFVKQKEWFRKFNSLLHEETSPPHQANGSMFVCECSYAYAFACISVWVCRIYVFCTATVNARDQGVRNPFWSYGNRTHILCHTAHTRHSSNLFRFPSFATKEKKRRVK